MRKHLGIALVFATLASPAVCGETEPTARPESRPAAKTSTPFANRDWPKYEFWRAVDADEDATAEAMLLRGVADGIPAARCLMARFNFLGVFGDPDYANAAKLYDGLAYGDCPEKALYLAVMYGEGLGVVRKARLSQHYYRKHAMFIDTIPVPRPPSGQPFT